MSDQPKNSAEPTPEDPYVTSDKPYAPPGKSTATYYPDESAGTMIGPYKLLQPLGKGGMGVVWLAEQTEPVQRRVAIKIIKGDLRGDQVLARFEAERQALAMMDHPNIAKVLDAGTIPHLAPGESPGAGAGGRPYFVMELVKGIPFTKYCDQEKLTLKERLELFIPVCNAVQHAHQKGVVHRDLKPSNVLIALYDSKPVPKVIDFGLAKALHHKLTDSSLSPTNEPVGTVFYMAPEQADVTNLDIDTRADIYSLGVMLYEVLTGSLPLKSEAMYEMFRLIREVEPAKPSTKLSSSEELSALAAKRKLEPRKLAGMVQGDLDWIVMKCLEKERARRYDTANQLGDELKRYMADEPVQAGPPSASYRARKFLRRNKGQVLAITMVFLALLGGVIGTSIGLVKADRALDKALKSAEAEKLASKKASDALDAATKAQEQRALAQVNALRTSAPGGVPGILAELQANPDTILPQLRERFAGETDPAKRMRLALALLPVEPDKVRDDLAAWMLGADDPAEVLLVRDALMPHKAKLLDRLWAVVEKPGATDYQRLRAAAALADYDPENPRWDKMRGSVVADLVAVNPIFLGPWRDGFRPLKGKLLASLSDIYGDQRPERSAERTMATSLLAEYADAEPQVLANLLMDGDDKQFAVIFPKFQRQSERGLPLLSAEIDKKLPPGLPSSDDSREKLAKRQANAAVALLRMKQEEKVWNLLKRSKKPDDPRVRSYLIHRLGPLGADAKAIVKRLDSESDDTIRRALILSLGEYGEKGLSADDRGAVTGKLQKIYCTAADPGLHAAAEWLLRTWKEEGWLKKTDDAWAADRKARDNKIDAVRLAAEGEEKSPQWYVNGQGHTMIVIPGRVEFMMGSPAKELGRFDYELQHKRGIGRTFAIAAKPVTMGQILKMRDNYFGKDISNVRRISPTNDCPAVAISWHDAAEYCNWLSDKEGIEDHCYDIDAKTGLAKLKKNYLNLSGYRLPTEAEMEYATRAGATTSRYYGETEELLPKYAWYNKNARDQTQPVGGLKPNDLGLFDVQGNVYTWCVCWYAEFRATPGQEVKEDQEQMLVGTSRVLRGGSFIYRASFVRSANRTNNVPTFRISILGFRVARTLPPDGFTSLPLTPKGSKNKNIP